MKKLNPNYFEFFFSNYGFIFIAAYLVAIPISFFGENSDSVFLLSISLVSVPFISFLCISGYRSLKKNMSLANVFLIDDSLNINGIKYSSAQIDDITHLSVRNILNKFPTYFIEVKTNDGGIFYFLDRGMNWKFKSPTITLLSKHPLFSSKIKDSKDSSDGFSTFKK